MIPLPEKLGVTVLISMPGASGSGPASGSTVASVSSDQMQEVPYLELGLVQIPLRTDDARHDVGSMV